MKFFAKNFLRNSCLSLVAAVSINMAAANPVNLEDSSLHLIPLPQTLEEQEGTLIWDENMSISAPEECLPQAEFFASQLRAATGWDVPIVADSGTISLELLSPDQAVPLKRNAREKYALSVTPEKATIQAFYDKGLIAGFYTLCQLCPAEVFDRNGAAENPVWELPCVEIIDEPRFIWRGILVDVARHFQSIEQMKRVVDAMAMVKLNVLHWHLTDDQGWRVEIKGYPQLTEGSDQFYTQEEIREFVAYASDRGIAIVPEFDVPGHSRAAIQAIPEIGTPNENGSMSNVLNPASEATWEFVHVVFGELAELFPSPIFHLGADEVSTGAWGKHPDCLALVEELELPNAHHLQEYFVERTVEILSAHGKQALAWDEAFHNDRTPENLMICSWRGVEPGMKAAEAGHFVVMCPVSSLYYDRANSRSLENPQAYSANTVTLNQSYFFEACSPRLSEEAHAYVLGAQGCIWGEKIRGEEHLSRQVMLRGAALSESLWSQREQLNWDNFLQRLATHRSRLDAANIAYWWEPSTTATLVGQFTVHSEQEQQTVLKLDNIIERKGLHEVMLHWVNGEGTFTVTSVELLANGEVIATNTHDSVATIDPRGPNQHYGLEMEAEFDPSAEYAIRIFTRGDIGGCEAVAMILPALAEGQYSQWSSPEGDGNRAGRPKPEEN